MAELYAAETQLAVQVQVAKPTFNFYSETCELCLRTLDSHHTCCSLIVHVCVLAAYEHTNYTAPAQC